jgi:hypothetical protein
MELAETDVGLIQPGQSFELRFRADPGRLLRGRILRVFPGPVGSGPSGRRFLVLGGLPAAPPGTPLGSSGLARLEVGHWTLSERMARVWARLVRADLWL